jgi:hypothetical protein
MRCISPIILKNEGSQRRFTNIVPCGKCLPCRSRRANQWAVRLQNEAKNKEAYMYTLTYEEPPLSINNIPTLKKEDLQLFFKRVRADFEPRGRGSKDAKKVLAEVGNPHRFKYYAAGEYGGAYGRPHYHAIIIGGFPTLHKNIHKYWKDGFIHQAPLNIKTIRYALKYLTKGTSGANDLGENERAPEFQLMSKGLGAQFMSPKMVEYYKSTLNNYLCLEDGVKVALPRYYKDKMLNDVEKLLMQAKTLNYIEELNKNFNPKKEDIWKREIIRVHAKRK